MGFGLAKATIGSKAFVPITESEYAALVDARRGTRLGLSVEQKFDLVVESYLDVEKGLLSASADFMVLSCHDYQSSQTERGLFNRLVHNLLAAGRTYADHVPQHVERLMRADESALERVKSFLSREYDAHLGYRAMCALRNYAQHSEFPVHVLGHNAKWVGPEDQSRLRHTTRLGLLPAELAADGDFKRSVLQELELLGKEVDLMWLLRDYVQGLWSAHQSIREDIDPTLANHETVMRLALDKFESESDEDSQHLAAWVEGESGTLTGKELVFLESIEYRLFLRRKNANLGNLTACFVSSESAVDGT